MLSKPSGSHGVKANRYCLPKAWHERLTGSFVKRIHVSSYFPRDFPVFAEDHKIFIYLIDYLLEKRHWFAVRTLQLEHQVTVPEVTESKNGGSQLPLNTHSRTTTK